MRDAPTQKCQRGRELGQGGLINGAPPPPPPRRPRRSARLFDYILLRFLMKLNYWRRTAALPWSHRGIIARSADSSQRGALSPPFPPSGRCSVTWVRAISAEINAELPDERRRHRLSGTSAKGRRPGSAEGRSDLRISAHLNTLIGGVSSPFAGLYPSGSVSS